MMITETLLFIERLLNDKKQYYLFNCNMHNVYFFHKSNQDLQNH